MRSRVLLPHPLMMETMLPWSWRKIRHVQSTDAEDLEELHGSDEDPDEDARSEEDSNVCGQQYSRESSYENASNTR